MSAPPLTLRNLTSTPIELKLIERYEPEEHKHLREITNLTKKLPFGYKKEEAAPVENQSFAHQDVSVRVEPFTTVNTGIAATERFPQERWCGHDG